jgi:hypothetical protein
MAFVQYIYTSILMTELSARNAFDTSAMSAKICEQFGITGRVFANRQKALAITEGPEEIVTKYFQSVQQDPLAQSVLLLVNRPIPVREFMDYSVWLNLGQDFEFSQSVRKLTAASLRTAWPSNLSTKVRIMADAYLDPAMLAA